MPTWNRKRLLKLGLFVFKLNYRIVFHHPLAAKLLEKPLAFLIRMSAYLSERLNSYREM